MCMTYFDDIEHGILLSAMEREKDVCKQVDEECCREPYEISLVSVCSSICKKISDIQHKLCWNVAKDRLPDPVDIPSDYFSDEWKLVKTAHGYYIACYRTTGRINSNKGAWWVHTQHGDMKILNERVLYWRNIWRGI